MKLMMYIEELDRHIDKLEKNLDYLDRAYNFPLKAEYIETILENDDETLRLDSIAYRFAKLQDSLGKAFRIFLYEVGENVDNMSMIDVLNLCERLGLEINPKIWMDSRKIRNEISHEYIIDYDKVATALNDMKELFVYLKRSFKILKEKSESISRN
jgi:hypothetical protein